MKSRRWERTRLLARLSILLVCSSGAMAWMTGPANAQSGLGSGRIEGTVLDSSEAAVAGAGVTAQNDSTGVSTTQTSDANGYFLFPYCVTPLPIWDATLNNHFGRPLFAAPKYGSRNLQISTRFNF